MITRDRIMRIASLAVGQPDAQIRITGKEMMELARLARIGIWAEEKTIGILMVNAGKTTGLDVARESKYALDQFEAIEREFRRT